MTPDEREMLKMAGVLDWLGHPIHVPKPRPNAGKLAALLLEESPTPETFDEVYRLIDVTPKARHGALLKLLLAAHAHRWVFQYALLIIWCNGGGPRVVAEAAGSRENLKGWFTKARFDWPAGEMIADAVTVFAPATMVLYRGGRGDPAEVAKHYSWTPHRAIAAHYAVANLAPYIENDAQPVIVRRTVTRKEVGLKWINGQEETLLFDEGPFEVDCTDPDELGDLLAEALVLREKFEAQRTAWIARHRANARGNIAR